MANESGSAANEIEVVHRKGRSHVRLHLESDAVSSCLEKDGVLTLRFQQVASTKLTDLPSAEVVVN